MDAEQPKPAPGKRLIRAYVTKSGAYTNCLIGVDLFEQKPPAPPGEDDCPPDHIRGEKPS